MAHGPAPPVLGSIHWSGAYQAEAPDIVWVGFSVNLAPTSAGGLLLGFAGDYLDSFEAVALPSSPSLWTGDAVGRHHLDVNRPRRAAPQVNDG